MTSYDSMSVHELRNHYDALLLEEVILKKLQVAAPFESLCADKEKVFAALRKAVIREASVGVGTVRRAGEEPLPDAPQMFDLIPHKETP